MQVWAVPFALVLVVMQFAFSPIRSFVGIASTISALIGVFVAPARRVFNDWNFRILAEPTGLRLAHGLVETRSQTLPAGRVQSVELVWPLLWRPAGWLHGRIDIAGYGGGEREGTHVNQLFPVGDLVTARRVLAEVLNGVDLTLLDRSGVPGRARWLAPLRKPQLGAGVDPLVFAAWDGFVTRRLVVVPYERIQSVRIVQGPLQRLLNLASVHVDTAGNVQATAAHRDVGDARLLAAELVSRARSARRQPGYRRRSVPGHRPPESTTEVHGDRQLRPVPRPVPPPVP